MNLRDEIRRFSAPTGVTIEGLEARCLLSTSPNLSSPAPELATSLTPLPAAVRFGQAGSTLLGVTNLGSTPVQGRLQVTIYATTNGTLNTIVDTVRVANQPIVLRPTKTLGQFQNYIINFRYPANLDAGTYQLIATTSFDGVVSAVGGFDSSVVLAEPFVSLSAQFGQVPTLLTAGILPRTGESLVIQNTGNQDTNGLADVDVYESATPTLSSSSTLLQTFSNLQLSIAADSSQSLPLPSKAISINATLGTEYLIATVDVAHTRPQSVSTSLTVAAPFATQFVTGLFVSSPSQAQLGHSVPLQINLTNTTDAPLHGQENINIYQSPTPSLTSDSNLLQTFSRQPLSIAKATTESFSLALNVPTTAQLGDQYLIAVFTPVSPLASNQTTSATIVDQVITEFIEPIPVSIV